jgi:hypothetical protein
VAIPDMEPLQSLNVELPIRHAIEFSSLEEVEEQFDKEWNKLRKSGPKRI